MERGNSKAIELARQSGQGLVPVLDGPGGPLRAASGWPPPLWRLPAWFSIAVVSAIVAAGVMACWVGYIESDDGLYAVSAQGWIDHFPYFATAHWGLRHVIVLPMALFAGLFGWSELAMAGPILLFSAVLVGLTAACVGRVSSLAAGLLAAMIVATLPLFTTNASIVATDIPEAVFVLASCWAFHAGWRRPGAAWFVAWFVASGVLAGLAFITRETTVALLAVYLVLFAANYGGRRTAYVWMGVGFALVAGADTAFLWWGTGDPLYRIHVSMAGVSRDNPTMAVLFGHLPGFDTHGLLAAPAGVKPLLMLAANQNFGLLYWVGIPATIWLALSRQPSEARSIARVFGLVALLWFVVLSYGLTMLWVIPRYQFVSACALVPPLVLALDRLWRRGHRAAALAPALALLASGVLLSSLLDRGLMFGEHALVAFARTADGPVTTDADTLRSAGWLLRLEGLEGRVTAAEPMPGALYVLNSHPRRAAPGAAPLQRPHRGWVSIARFEEPVRPGVALLDALRITPLLPGIVAHRLETPPRVLEAFRIPR